MTYLDGLVVLVALGCFALFALPGIRNNPGWRAMVTPLASIIGSGFLVIAPMLAEISGRFAVLDMVGIVVVAFVIGAVIRFNIAHSEPLQTGKVDCPTGLITATRLAQSALTVAYVISVAFYIRLLASFVLSLTPYGIGIYEDGLATLVLLLIGFIGWWRGLHGLEFVETLTVSVKLSIIVAMLLALALHNGSTGVWLADLGTSAVDPVTHVRMLAGMLLVVQGFETSRYLGHEYSAGLRRSSMRWAQIVSGVIYIAFVALVMPLLVFLPHGVLEETAIIALTGHVALILPLILVLAAFMSQMSAAIADTVGAGGLLAEESGERISENAAYPALIGLAIVLIWSFNIFEVITIASRAFAFYYMMQALIAFLVAGWLFDGWKRGIYQLWLLGMIVVLGAVVVFAIPVE